MASQRPILSARRRRLLEGRRSPAAAPAGERRSLPFSDASVLHLLFVVMLLTYPSLGRDVFFNHVDHPERFDVYGAVAAYLRPLVAAAPLLYITAQHRLQAVGQAAPRVLLPFLLWAAASSLWSVTWKQTIQDSLQLVLLCLSTAVVVQRVGVVSVARTMLGLIAMVVVASALMALLVPSIGVHGSANALQAAHAGRWRGIFSHKNGLGPWAAYGAVLLVAHRDLLSIRPVALWAAVVSAVACLIFSGSSSSLAIVPVLVSAGWLVPLRRRLSGAGFVLAVAGVAVLAGGFGYLLAEPVLRLLGRDPTLTGRTELWSLAGRQIGEHPANGAGYMTFGGPDYLDAVMRLYGQTLSAENVYLQMLLELGLVGAVLGVGAVTAAVVAGLRRGSAATGDEEQAWRMLTTLAVTTLALGVTNADALTPVGPFGSLDLIAVTALLTPALTRRLRLGGPPPALRAEPTEGDRISLRPVPAAGGRRRPPSWA